MDRVGGRTAEQEVSMRTIDWNRWAAATGFGFVAAVVLGLLLVRDEPGPRASSAEIEAWLGGDRSEILTAAIVFGVAVVFLLWFAATVAVALVDVAEPRLGVMAFGGAAAFAAFLVATVGIVAGLAFSVDAVDSESAAGLFAVHWGLHVMSWFPFAVLIGATSIAAGRKRLFGAWYYWGSEAAAVVVLLGGTVWAKDGFWAPAGAYSSIVGAVALAWVLVTSSLLLRR
jgi:hypothetical protein